MLQKTKQTITQCIISVGRPVTVIEQLIAQEDKADGMKKKEKKILFQVS